ncbi:MAG: hypothetical protein ACLFTE_11025 [Salinivenus sp.]
MDPREERLIEQLVHRPDSLSPAERKNAERLLGDDPGAALYAKFLQGFYNQLDEERERPLDPHIDTFVDDLFGAGLGAGPAEGPTSIPVEPYTPGAPAGPTVLAAATRSPPPHTDDAEPDAPRFSVLATLASADEKVLVRVVGDRHTNRGRLYVMAEPKRRQAHVVVSFPELGLHLATDEDGRATFSLPTNGIPSPSASDAPSDPWAEISALVRRPVAVRRLPPDSTAVLVPDASEPDAPEPNRLLCRYEHGTLTVTPADEDASQPAFLSVTEGEQPPALLSLRSSAPIQRAVPMGGPLTLRLYV